MVNENLAQRTKQSPRFENGMLCFYEGDTFDLELELNLTEDGEPVAIKQDDLITLEFYGDKCKDKTAVASIEFTNIENNKITLRWTPQFTANFKRGRYTYRMKYNSSYITTLVADNAILVS